MRRRRAPQRVALFGLFGIGNFGNEASLAAGIEAVRRALPTAAVSTVSTDPELVARLHGVPGHAIGDAWLAERLTRGGRLRRIAGRPVVELGRWVAAVRHLRTVDLLLVPGTGVLDDMGQAPTQLPLDVLRWSLAARLTGRRLLYLSIGAGPIHHPVSRRLMRAALRQSDLCSYRDEGSRTFMASIGRDTAADEVWPDLVFGLDRPVAPLRTGPGPETVALGIMDYRGWQGAGAEAERIHAAYVAETVALTRALRGRGHPVRLVVGDDADLPTADAVVAAVGDPAVLLCRSAAFDDVLAALAPADVIVAARFHNLVAALLTGIPAVSISYAAKNDQLLASVGLGSMCTHVDRFTADEVLGLLDAVLADRAALATQVRVHTAELRDTVRARVDATLRHEADRAGDR